MSVVTITSKRINVTKFIWLYLDRSIGFPSNTMSRADSVAAEPRKSEKITLVTTGTTNRHLRKTFQKGICGCRAGMLLVLVIVSGGSREWFSLQRRYMLEAKAMITKKLEVGMKVYLETRKFPVLSFNQAIL